MKTLRSHILKVGVIFLVCSGLMIGIAKPADAAHSNKDFAHWLQSLAKKAHTQELKEKLASLQHSDGNLSQLIARASQIVSQNNDEFNLPAHAASDNIQQILLVEWSQYQTGNNTMTPVPSVETAKPLITPQQHPFFRDHLNATKPGKPKISCTARVLTAASAVTHFIPHITPLISGIAIGAP